MIPDDQSTEWGAGGGGRVSRTTRTHPTNPTNITSNLHSADNNIVSQLRRRAASRRLSGGDPWWYPPPGERGYPEAAAHLLSCGLTPAPNVAAVRSMWKVGGESRRIAQVIAERWECAA